MKNKEFKDRVFLLRDKSAPLCFMLPSRNTARYPLHYFDETTGSNRSLRYARNQKSPFEDEQDGNFILEPIVFEDGVLVVPRNNPVLQKFMDIHPANGDIFSEFDPEKDAETRIEYLNFELDAQIAAREMSIDSAEAVLRVMVGGRVDKMTSQEIRRDIMVYARNNPEDFLDMIDDSDLHLRNKSAKFIDAGLLQFRSNKRDVFFNLPNNKKKMMSVPMGEEPLSAMSAFFKTDEGIEIEQSLEKLLQ
jgi:hypothetical protein